LDTKSKNSKPFLAWLSFFAGLSLLFFILFSGFAALVHSGGNFEVLKLQFSKDYKDTAAFKERTANYFDQLTYAATADNVYLGNLSDEGDNLRYYLVNQATGLTLKNTGEELKLSPSSGLPVLPDGYSYFWYFDGEKLQVIDNGRPVDIKRTDSGYREITRRLMTNHSGSESAAALANTRIVLAVKDILEENPYGHSDYYAEQKFISIIKPVYGLLVVLTMVCLGLYLFQRQEKQRLDKALAAWSGKFWIEAKAFLSFMVLIFLAVVLEKNYWLGLAPFTSEFVLNATAVTIALLITGWWFYLMLIDLLVNRKAFFGHNLVNTVINWYRKLESRYPWQEAMLKRAYFLLAAVTVLSLFSVFFLLQSVGTGNSISFIMSLILAATGVYLIIRYMKRFQQTVTSMGQVVDHI